MPNFEDIVVRCDGMLAPAIYKRLYETALHSGGGLIIEVGTAHGAATVALALGLRDSRAPGRVISFDKLTGGPRRHVVGPDERLKIIQRNFAHFGVNDIIQLVVGDVRENAHAVPRDAHISVLVLDADGRIDRDMFLFFDQIVPGGAVVIDDCKDVVRLTQTGLSTYRVDAKMKLTTLLLSHFQAKKLLSEGQKLGNTYFGEKMCSDDGCSLDPYEVLEIYRSLVFTDAKLSVLDTGRQAAIRVLERYSPILAQRLRVVQRRRRYSSHPNC